MRRTVTLLGPAFVAAMAYVDPGNVAANLSAGAGYGYLLVWALALACLMAMLIQYLSAKLGVITGRSLSELVRDDLHGRRGGRWLRLVYAGQALTVAIATDLAEVVGGAIALHLLFGLPLWLGAVVVGVVSLSALHWLRRRGEAVFETLLAGVLGIIALGFLSSLLWMPPDPVGIASGLVPRFAGDESVQLAAAMLGATVMPHAVYLHAALAKDRHRGSPLPVSALLRAQRVDVTIALSVAALVNIAMLLFAAAGLRGAEVDSIEAAHAEIGSEVGAIPAVIFAVGLLVSGVGSAIVGTDAGAGMVRDLVSERLTPTLRRLLTLVPAVTILAAGLPPTEALVQSQLVLSFGIAFAVVPLVWLTSRRRIMGKHRNPPWLTSLAWAVVAAILALNVAVIWASVPF